MSILTDSDIANLMQMEINRTYSPAQREQINARGTAADKATLKAFFVGMGDKKVAMTVERDFTVAVRNFDEATVLLADPILDPLAVDDNGALLYPDMVDIDGVATTNQLLLSDTAARNVATATLAASTAKVTTFVKKRDAAIAKELANAKPI
ncbi:MAG: hypothetical protein R8K20_11935 [Gallionellaceae bacterium]